MQHGQSDRDAFCLALRVHDLYFRQCKISVMRTVSINAGISVKLSSTFVRPGKIKYRGKRPLEHRTSLAGGSLSCMLEDLLLLYAHSGGCCVTSNGKSQKGSASSISQLVAIKCIKNATDLIARRSSHV